MPKGVYRAILNSVMTVFLLGIIYACYVFLPWQAQLSVLDIWTSLAVLIVAELAVLHGGKLRFRFRMAAQLPLLLHFGVFPVLIGQSLILLAIQIRELWVTRTYSPHYPRIVSAILVPAVSGAVYHAVVFSGPSAQNTTVAVLGAAVAFWITMAVFHLFPGRRTVIHPWKPMLGWLPLLLLMDAIMAFGAIVQQSLGANWAEIAVTFELVAVMLSMALYSDASIRKFQLIKLTTLVSELSSDVEWAQLTEHLFQGIRDIIVGDVAALWLLKEDGRLYPYQVHSYGGDATQLEEVIWSRQREGTQLGMGLIGFAASSQDVICVRSSREPLLFQWADMRRLAPSALATPILIDGAVMAVLSVYHSTALSAYSAREQSLFRVLSKQLSSIFTMLWRYEQTKTKAEIDELTGLYNYRYFDHALHECVADSDARRQPLTLLLIDLDHFKRINDKYGHLAGNQILVDLAKTLKDMVRTHDIVARYGGEEFTILLPGLSSQEGQAIAERIRHQVEHTHFNIEPGLTDPTRPALAESGVPRTRTVRLTLSIGVATYPDKADSALTLIRHADRAMYVGSKQSGRNKVSTYV